MTRRRNPDPRSASKRAKGQPARAGYDDKRYKAARERLKLIGNHICAWCNQPIDMQHKHPHPLSWSCDHRTPRSQLTPDDIRHWHIDHLLEAHLRCNEARGDKPLPMHPAFTPLGTSIDW